MAYWLVKSESNNYSIDDLKRDGSTDWTGVRNYQARNYLKSMKKGDVVLYYHSVVEPVGVVGIASVIKEATPDRTQFDPKSEYYDPSATKETPRWFCPEVSFKEKFKAVLPLKELKKNKRLNGMVLLQKMSRLSVQPVSEEHFKVIVDAARAQE